MLGRKLYMNTLCLFWKYEPKKWKSSPSAFNTLSEVKVSQTNSEIIKASPSLEANFIFFLVAT